MAKTLIGIAGNQLLEAADVFQGNQVTYTPQGFVHAIQQTQALPIVLPISDPSNAAQYIRSIDKLLLAGGQDVSPRFYDEEPHRLLGKTDPTRDAFELALVREAIKQKKPIMAVCRGLQLVNVALGGTLYQDLSLNEESFVKHEQQPTAPTFATHSVTIDPNSRLVELLPEEYWVNSYHHQALRTLGEGLRAVAWSKDGVIEAVESEQFPLLGIQWHPELTHEVSKQEQNLFRYFVEEL